MPLLLSRVMVNPLKVMASQTMVMVTVVTRLQLPIMMNLRTLSVEIFMKLFAIHLSWVIG